MNSSDTVHIVNYGAGNVYSAANAIEFMGGEAILTDDPNELVAADKILLPGVGSFRACVDELRRRNLVGALEKRVLHDGAPFLGVCVGMQMLAEHGDEGGDATGLGWFSGSVVKFDLDTTYRLPHVGWNDILMNRKHPVLDGLENNAFYFTHSYHFRPDNTDDIIAVAQYGYDFPCIIGKDNLIATQFHPEKSGDAGLDLFENFLRWDGSC